MTNLNLYLVDQGIVTDASDTTEWDIDAGQLLVAATDTDQALAVASAYDAGKLTIDNINWHGKTIAVARFN
jgi:hypothetical protein